MVTSSELINLIRSITMPSQLEESQQVLADAIATTEVADAVAEEVFLLFEKFPAHDFGMPGPLTHALESHCTRHQYVERIMQSISRRPTPQTLIMVRRVHPQPASIAAALRVSSERSDLPEDIRSLVWDSIVMR